MEPTPKKLLDQACTELCQSVRACTEPAEVTPSASNTTPSAPSRPMSTGSNATSPSITCAILPRWVQQKFRPFSPTWPWREMSPLPPFG